MKGYVAGCILFATFWAMVVIVGRGVLELGKDFGVSIPWAVGIVAVWGGAAWWAIRAVRDAPESN
jgi:hypothetical protein